MTDEITADQVAYCRELADARRQSWARQEEIIRRLREALEHTTELLVDTWHTAMDSDPEREVAVVDARHVLTVGQALPGE